MSHTISIPKEGLKVLAIVGYIDNAPIWRQVGLARMSANSNLLVCIDRSFNPAGCGEPKDMRVNLVCKEHTADELAKRPDRAIAIITPHRSSKTRTAEDFDDDIPF